MIFRCNKTKYNIKKWPDIMKGHTAFILGNGPSINENNLLLLEKYFTIGINRIFKIYFPTILFWQDKEITKSYYEEICKCPSIKVCRDIYDYSSSFTNYSLNNEFYKFHKTPWHLYGRGCSGGLAIQLAYSMGFDSIVLIGCDCKYIDGKTDFYGKNNFHKPHTLVHFNQAMKWVKDNIDIPIYNCGYCPYWPRTELKDVLEKVNTPKMEKVDFLSALR